MERVACDLCGADEADVRMQKDEWRLVRCRRCSLVYLDPRPAPDVIEKDYDWFRHAPLQTRVRRARENPVRTLLRKARGKGLFRRKPRERVVLDRIREFAPGGRFLDVGCGDGLMVETMAAAGYEAHGLDISDVAVAEAHRRGRHGVRKGTIHAAPFDAGSFDVILLMSYLEHEHQPSRALERTRALLRPGGHVFVKVPHYGSWNRWLHGSTWCGYFFPQHLYYFTPKTIARLFDKCGLATVRNGFWDHVPVSDVLWATARRPA
ncbi:MAG: class I SAM-dependent methyltransferase [Planctomycetota bacterium]|jgi:2-polyprenyl-3-methyl-5-hydroxy-6-metoxy-1,4-benzoquinol methylase